jgi:hypothetical protein
MNHRRIVCWIGLDAASIVAAKLAIRENETEANPLPVVIVAHRYIGDAALEQAAHYLGIPVTLLSPSQFIGFDMPGDVHVWGVCADGALRRDDCETLARRAGLTWFVPPYFGFAQKVAA